MSNMFRNIIRWYFSKNALPYWCLLLMDMVLVVVSGLLTYWAFNRTGAMFEARHELFLTIMAIALLSVMGARLFRTYSGILRYSSFVDLIHVAYANGVSLVLALLMTWVAGHFHIEVLSAMTKSQVVVMFMIATLLMTGMRVLVKTLYDVMASDARGMRVLIYGTLAGGVGLAKTIRTQNPRRFILRGFISHDPQANHFQLMGQRVYNESDDLAEVIKTERIKAVLVSPLRTNDFRLNQSIQDTLIASGVKIYMSQSAQEVSIDEDGVLTNPGDMQLHEVSVEDLLPRDEIRVDLKSVEELLKGKRVLITGSAGSIGSEIVRQVASFKPAAMMLLDQAETPQHDIRLMMAKDFPEIPAETVVTSICHEHRMESIFKAFLPDYVFHAAAYKHVPMMEDNPTEAVLNIYMVRRCWPT